MTQLRAVQYEIRAIDGGTPEWQEARAFISAHHYSGGCSRTAVYMHGLYEKGGSTLLGVAMWLPPTKVAAQSVNSEAWRRVLSLSRLAVHPAVPQNGATFLMGRSIRLIRQDARFLSLVTFADTFAGHEGKIYHATNWTYEGLTAPTPRWEDSEGRQVAKQSTRTRTSAEMLALGYRRNGSHRKHKFTMHLKIQRKGDKAPLMLTNDNMVLWWAVAV